MARTETDGDEICTKIGFGERQVDGMVFVEYFSLPGSCRYPTSSVCIFMDCFIASLIN